MSNLKEQSYLERVKQVMRKLEDKLKMGYTLKIDEGYMRLVKPKSTN